MGQSTTQTSGHGLWPTLSGFLLFSARFNINTVECFQHVKVHDRCLPLPKHFCYIFNFDHQVVWLNSNPYGEDDEKDCEEDGGHVEEEDPKEEAEEWRRPGQ